MPNLPIDLLFALLLGCSAGMLTGLAPGIHVNTVAAGVLATLPFLTKWFSPLSLGVLLVAMVIVHTFVDFIPSIFLGAPDDAETSLSILPGHRMLLEGRGYDALKLTVVGGIGASLVGLAILPLFGFAIAKGYDKLGIIIPILILTFSAIFILLEKGFVKKVWALLIFMLSGVLGVIVLNQLQLKEPLFPMLSGLFGISTLVISMFGENKIVEQKISSNIKFTGNWFNHVKACVSAALMSVLPALGGAQATVLAQVISKKDTRNEKGSSEDFLVMVGGINVVSSIFVLATLWLIGKARTGVLATMKQFLDLDFNGFLILLVASLVAIGIAAIVTLQLGKFVAKRITKFKYRKISLAVIVVLVLLAGLFAGWLGLLVTSVATAFGLIAPKVGVKRIHAMGCLAIPIVMYFI
ncbi:MAG: tripartite tricarboxylate transporter permease [DPANN group archaeon]|nr:tripartite tricarboxylate transporter permease [DPANN group archaeon]